MSYTKQNFVNDKVLYAEQLNNMDNQIELVSNSVYKGKYLSVLGDSISTFSGISNNAEQGLNKNAVFYTGTNSGVSSANDTYWMKTINALGMKLCVNNSWSGGYLTKHRPNVGAENDSDGSVSNAMVRCTKLHTSNNNPDVILIMIGINDFIANISLGTFGDDSASFPTDNTSTTIREAWANVIHNVCTAYPRAEVYLMVYPQAVTDVGTSKGVILEDYRDSVREVAELFGVKVIDLAKCGIKTQNASLYLPDDLHPNAAGHSLMANEIIRTLDPAVRIRYQ
jgi:lysophospholipase L1-like esterase